MIAPLAETQAAVGPWLVRGDPAHGGDNIRFSRLLFSLAFGDTGIVWPEQGEPARCYALLEGARIADLPERLEASGLDHVSLMRGEAGEALRDVAPYLVALDADHLLARQLLTPNSGPEAHWQRWGTGSVTLLRSHAAFADLERHFRKFTRIYDATEKRWTYFRFYAPEAMRGLVAHMNAAPFAQFSAPFLFALTEGRAREPVLIGRETGRMRAYLDDCVRHAH